MAKTNSYQSVQRNLQSPMKKSYVFAGVSLFVILIFLFGAIRPTLSTISKLKGDIEQRERIESQLQQKIDNLEQLQTLYNDNEDRLEFVDVFYPSNSDYSLVMASLERVVVNYGYQLKGVSIQVDEKASNSQREEISGMEPVAFTLSISGSRANLIPLIEHLEKLPIVPVVESLSWQPSTQDDEFGDTSATISMSSYKMINLEMED